jgi:hypothetical protein
VERGARIVRAAGANLDVLAGFLGRPVSIAGSGDGAPGGVLTLTRGAEPGALEWRYVVAVPTAPGPTSTESAGQGQEAVSEAAPVAVKVNFAIGDVTPYAAPGACLVRPGRYVTFAGTLSAGQVAALHVSAAHPITSITSTSPATLNCV